MHRDLRLKVEQRVATHPGESTRGLARAVGASESTVDYHLRRMRRDGRAVSEAFGREVCWFPAGSGFCPVLRRAIPALRRAEVATVARALSGEPRTAMAASRESGLPVGAVRWAADVLRDAGLAERTRWGKLQLVPGAEFCLGKAACAERCGRWGECPVSRAFLGRMSGIAGAGLMPPSRGREP